MSSSGQDRTNKDIESAWAGPGSWDYGREVVSSASLKRTPTCSFPLNN